MLKKTKTLFPSEWVFKAKFFIMDPFRKGVSLTHRLNNPPHLLLPPLCSGADVTEPNSSDSRGERLDFFVKQEEALTAEPSFLGTNENEEASRGAGAGISSVANLKAALMSKNSLLSLRAEMMGDDNPLLYEYLPKGGHSLSCK